MQTISYFPLDVSLVRQLAAFCNRPKAPDESGARELEALAPVLRAAREEGYRIQRRSGREISDRDEAVDRAFLEGVEGRLEFNRLDRSGAEVALLHLQAREHRLLQLSFLQVLARASNLREALAAADEQGRRLVYALGHPTAHLNLVRDVVDRINRGVSSGDNVLVSARSWIPGRLEHLACSSLEQYNAIKGDAAVGLEVRLAITDASHSAEPDAGAQAGRERSSGFEVIALGMPLADR